MSEPLYINGEINPKLQVRDALGRVKRIPKKVMEQIIEKKREKRESKDEVCDANVPRNAHLGV